MFFCLVSPLRICDCYWLRMSYGIIIWHIWENAVLFVKWKYSRKRFVLERICKWSKTVDLILSFRMNFSRTNHIEKRFVSLVGHMISHHNSFWIFLNELKTWRKILFLLLIYAWPPQYHPISHNAQIYVTHGTAFTGVYGENSFFLLEIWESRKCCCQFYILSKPKSPLNYRFLFIIAMKTKNYLKKVYTRRRCKKFETSAFQSRETLSLMQECEKKTQLWYYSWPAH